ncbi:hypothetical protein OUZ56_000716 [Daphnia magna]|uniref:Uncharacterized protein n=1 Tax=Daphnia magna TaxID=35525 RepID=A0ABR0A0Q3_9CRUS|nr:hypothetical protein OUZ56_000716 [Daphnia magna]
MHTLPMIEKTAKRNNRENCGGVDESLNVRSNGGRERGTNKFSTTDGNATPSGSNANESFDMRGMYTANPLELALRHSLVKKI